MTQPQRPIPGPIYPADRGLNPTGPERVTVNLSRAVVVSLPERQDRRDAFAARWAGYKLGYSFFDATSDLDNVESAVFESHMAALAQFDYGPILVLEDDAIPSEEFTRELTEVPADWQVLFLGGQHLADPVSIVSFNWEIPTKMLRTHAYVVRDPQALVTIARALISDKLMDPQLAQLPISVYSLMRFTVGQAAGTSDHTGNIYDTDRFWNERTDPPVIEG